jgi:nucleoside-diphosphate-sugar epimerase
VEGIRIAGELDEGLDGSRLAGAAFNLGNPEEVSIVDLATLCLEVTGSESEIYHDEVGHPGDSRRRVPDISETQRVLGWSPFQSLEEGLRSCWRWLQAEHS